MINLTTIRDLKILAKSKKKADIVIFEGWCVGATQKNKDLIVPINILKKRKIKRIWRNYVNKELKTNYKKIFKLIDTTIF